ncbi:uncharacterized protein MYCFIDRAFT_131200 [Pseudocercospora fijiensis CIRAD86]|uniref:Uncharacterized protein n=1 Tax=Pseudocercospora fijiensis (strain CIRAD86) TaxID=383855 RepID=M3B9V4_PSEFD|nr:uncharacterized protein MYCFIDRAFT_131200 [Pseudocercospora fijiensis CIRAD86]EME86107.1 hypothetical protein MYCFIDRAFT_131200 [Pseudocercospora fijiensis CIRAD86]
MSQARRKRPSCSHDNCGSRRFHVGDDGFTYCDQGHQQSEAGLLVSADTGELVLTGRTARRKLDSDAESTTTKVTGFSGPKAFEHYLLCVQLVLRKQLRWLIDVQKLPEELEGLVKDLWALRLQKLQNKVSYDSDAETDAQSSRIFSSQSEGDSGTDTENTITRRDRTRQKGPGPNMLELLGLLHIGIMLLKIPITAADMLTWCNEGALLFYRAVKEVPMSMRDRLPGHYQDLLEQQSLIEPEKLHRKVLELLTNLNSDFGMEAPTLNEPLVLYRWVKQLALPLEIYVTTQRLARLLEVDFAYNVVAKARANMSMRFPEIRLMSLIVIATKLLFPFDDKKRYPKNTEDLAAMRLDWGVWCKTEISKAGKTSAEKIVQVQAALRARRIVPETEPDDIPRVGTLYTQYTTVEDLGGATREFYEGAAQLAGFSLRGIVRAVCMMEHKLFKLERAWTKNDRKD